MAEQLVASQEELCSMQLLSYKSTCYDGLDKLRQDSCWSKIHLEGCSGLGDVAEVNAGKVDLANSQTYEMTTLWNSIIILSAGILVKEGN
jgi:hypothetical protein